MNGGGASEMVDEDGQFHTCHQAIVADRLEAGPPDPRKGLNPKVIEVYTKFVSS